MIRSHAQLNSPIRKKRRRFEHHYDRQHLDAVVQKVKDGELTINSAADLYAIPRTTISSRLRKDGWYSKDSIPSDPQLPHQIKAEILIWLTKMKEIACPSVTKALPFVVQEICEMFGEHTAFPADNLPSEEYCKRLLSELHDLNTDFSDDPRGKAKASVIDSWLKKLRSLLENHYGLDADTFLSGSDSNLGQIFCCSQLAMLLKRDDSSTGILVNSFSEEIRERQQLLAMYTCLGADGSALSPLLVVKSRSSEQKYFVSPTSSGTSFEIWSREGFMNADVLLDWLQLIVHEIGDVETSRPLLIFLDHSVEHVSLAVLDFCQVNMIILFYLPGQCSMARLGFGSRIFDDVFQMFSGNPGKGRRTISKTSSLSVLPELWSHLHGDSVAYEFQRLGLVPLNDETLKQNLKSSNFSFEALDRESIDAVPSSSKKNPPSGLEICSVASEKSSASSTSVAGFDDRVNQSENRSVKQSEVSIELASIKSNCDAPKKKGSDSNGSLSKSSQNLKEKPVLPRRANTSVMKTTNRKRKYPDSVLLGPRKAKCGKLKTAFVSSTQLSKETSSAVDDHRTRSFLSKNRSDSVANDTLVRNDVLSDRAIARKKVGDALPKKNISAVTSATPDCSSPHSENQKSIGDKAEKIGPLKLPSNRKKSVDLPSGVDRVVPCDHFAVPGMEDRLQGAYIGVAQALHLVESSLPEDLLLMYRDRLNRISGSLVNENSAPARSNVTGLNSSKSNISDPILSDPSFIIWSKLKQSLPCSVSLTDETLATARSIQTAYERVCGRDCGCQIEKCCTNTNSMHSLQKHGLARREGNLSSQLKDHVPFSADPISNQSDSTEKVCLPQNVQRPLCFKKFLAEKIDHLQVNADIDLGNDSQNLAPEYQPLEKAIVENSELGGNNKTHWQSLPFTDCQHVKPPFVRDSVLEPTVQPLLEPSAVSGTSTFREIHPPIKLEPFKTAFGGLGKTSSSSPLIMGHPGTPNIFNNPSQNMIDSGIKQENGTAYCHRSDTFSCDNSHECQNHSNAVDNDVGLPQIPNDCQHQKNILWNRSNAFRGHIVPRANSLDRSISSCQYSDSGISLTSGHLTPQRRQSSHNSCNKCCSLSLPPYCNTQASGVMCDDSAAISLDGSSTSAASRQQNIHNFSSPCENRHGEQYKSHPISFLERSGFDSSFPGVHFIQEPNLTSLNSLNMASSNIESYSSRRLPEASNSFTHPSGVQAGWHQKAFLGSQDRRQFLMSNPWLKKFEAFPSNISPGQPITSTPLQNTLMNQTASELEHASRSASFIMPYPKFTADCNSRGEVYERHYAGASSGPDRTSCSPGNMGSMHSSSLPAPQRFMKSDTYTVPSLSRSSCVTMQQYPMSSSPRAAEISRSATQSFVRSHVENTNSENASSSLRLTTSDSTGHSSALVPFHHNDRSTSTSQHFPCSSNPHAISSVHKLESNDLELQEDDKTANFGFRPNSPEYHSPSVAAAAAAAASASASRQTTSLNACTPTYSEAENMEQCAIPTMMENATLDSAESEFNVITSTPLMKDCSDQVTHFREVASQPKLTLLAARKPVRHGGTDTVEDTASTRRLLNRYSGRKKLSRILPAVDDSSFSDDERDLASDEGKGDAGEPIRHKIISDENDDSEDVGRASAGENLIESENKSSDEEMEVSHAASGEESDNGFQSQGSNTLEHSKTVHSDVHSSASKQLDWSSGSDADPLDIDNLDSELPNALTLEDISDVFHDAEQLSPRQVDDKEQECQQEFEAEMQSNEA